MVPSPTLAPGKKYVTPSDRGFGSYSGANPLVIMSNVENGWNCAKSIKWFRKKIMSN